VAAAQQLLVCSWAAAVRGLGHVYLADSTQLQELRLKGSPSGRDYIGPPGETPGPQDREILSYDGRVMLLKYVDLEIDGRYGTGIFVRCAPRA
jgi:hypothetical protein